MISFHEYGRMVGLHARTQEAIQERLPEKPELFFEALGLEGNWNLQFPTTYYPYWDLEVISLVLFPDNEGTSTYTGETLTDILDAFEKDLESFIRRNV